MGNSTSKKVLTGAEIIWECLLQEKVSVIFGYPGGAILPAYDALTKYKDQIHHVLTRHEQGATHMEFVMNVLVHIWLMDMLEPVEKWG